MCAATVFGLMTSRCAMPPCEKPSARSLRKVKFASTKIDSILISGGTATITGSGLVNGVAVTFKVVAKDGSPDTFSIELSNGYKASGNVTTGRGVTVKPCPPPTTTPPTLERHSR